MTIYAKSPEHIRVHKLTPVEWSKGPLANGHPALRWAIDFPDGQAILCEDFAKVCFILNNLRKFAGMLGYTLTDTPPDFDEHDPETCPDCIERRLNAMPTPTQRIM